ncbi:unnamed protein product [Bursaphelenchus xylophilus]|uniref:(pine wood nematode) hypothetical protein n=1 Tax=Bursaphelenchus xylophilus TaxID=6326 RepID=A0A1I7RQ02_BURXY|nr:unnamed protein product [Bursaphelenchus xylophilus]CAG9096914.1 unnamed protein product [Bursaphelenchus xylophilus]
MISNKWCLSLFVSVVCVWAAPKSRFESELQKVFKNAKQCFHKKLLAEASSRIGKKLSGDDNSTVYLNDISVAEGSNILLDCLPKSQKSIVLINNLRQYSYGPPSDCAKKFGQSYHHKSDDRNQTTPTKSDVKDAFFNGQLDVCSLLIDVMNPFYCNFKKACPRDIQDFQVTYAALYSMQQLLLNTEKPLVCMQDRSSNEPLGTVINPAAYEKSFNVTSDPLIVGDFCNDSSAEGSGIDGEEGSGIGSFQSDSLHEESSAHVENGFGEQFWEDLRIEQVLNRAFN